MQRDLLDVLGSLESVAQKAVHAPGSSMHADANLLQDFLKENPIDESGLKGAAAGTKSYNSRSGPIVGILKEMKDEFERDLGSAQKEELSAEIGFQKMNAAKLGEIGAATKQLEAKKNRLALTQDQVAKAKEDIIATVDSLEAHSAFLKDMIEQCKIADNEYAKRSETRGDELVALSQTIEMLSADDARELFSRAINFLQTQSSRSSSHMMTQERYRQRAMQHLAAAAKRTGNWALGALAVNVQLDAFGKVKAMCDHMVAELQKQQKDEFDKKELCAKELDETEDKLKEANLKQTDLADANSQLSNKIQQLNANIDALKDSVARTSAELKKAGVNRKTENLLYQKTAKDQRATIQILSMARDRMKQFYASPSLIQVREHSAMEQPAAPPAYEKSAGGGGVLQLLAMIITDVGVAETETVTSEQHAQAAFASYVRDATASIEADRETIATDSKFLAGAKSDLSTIKENQLSNNAAVENLGSLLQGVHLDCDYVTKYFKLRQKTRADEIDSIQQAKAILSGANFDN